MNADSPSMTLADSRSILLYRIDYLINSVSEHIVDICIARISVVYIY